MMNILTGENNKTLRTVCNPVKIFDEDLQKIVDEMIKTMLNDEENGVMGIGLAANQVGLKDRIMIVSFNLNTKKPLKIVPMINPEILKVSENKISLEEGCLSLPDKFAKISRPSKIWVRWQNIEGNWCEKKLDKWDARIFLHEIDHLNGKMFVDYL